METKAELSKESYENRDRVKRDLCKAYRSLIINEYELNRKQGYLINTQPLLPSPQLIDSLTGTALNKMHEALQERYKKLGSQYNSVKSECTFFQTAETPEFKEQPQIAMNHTPEPPQPKKHQPFKSFAIPTDSRFEMGTTRNPPKYNIDALADDLRNLRLDDRNMAPTFQ